MLRNSHNLIGTSESNDSVGPRQLLSRQHILALATQMHYIATGRSPTVLSGVNGYDISVKVAQLSGAHTRPCKRIIHDQTSGCVLCLFDDVPGSLPVDVKVPGRDNH